MQPGDAERYMRLAMTEAAEAAKSGNRPFGAVIIDPAGNLAVAEHNRVVEQSDPSAHAEITAIRRLCRERRAVTLEGYRLLTNAQSCPMCFACAVEVRISDLYYGAPAVPGVWPAISIEELSARYGDRRVRVHGGVLGSEAIEQLRRLSE
jgi:tRNA(adenine34) deaminase